nr:hypothetical protein SHINE37_44644 [Rhizobiaceae bacterium]
MPISGCTMTTRIIFSFCRFKILVRDCSWTGPRTCSGQPVTLSPPMSVLYVDNDIHLTYICRHVKRQRSDDEETENDLTAGQAEAARDRLQAGSDGYLHADRLAGPPGRRRDILRRTQPITADQRLAAPLPRSHDAAGDQQRSPPTNDREVVR